jgi:hypothetical protein
MKTLLKTRSNEWEEALLRSRRNLLVGSVGGAGALGALQVLNATEARAENREYWPQDNANIDLFLLNSLRSNRKNSEDPGVALSSKGLLVGFGPNLLFCKNDALMTYVLYAKGRKILESTTREDVADFIPELVVGTKGTATQIIKDFAGNKVTSKIVVESINDVPDDFLITGVPQSNLYTGAFFQITIEITGKNGNIATVKTTYDALTGLFPLGVVVSPISELGAIDSEAASLATIAGEIIQTKFAASLAVVPTDLQRDFSWKKLFRKILVVSAAVTAIARLGSILTASVCPPCAAVLAGISYVSFAVFLVAFVALAFLERGNN